jgi:hypothetical protein
MDHNTATFAALWTDAGTLPTLTKAATLRISRNLLTLLAAIWVSTDPSASAADHREIREQRAPVIRVCVLNQARVDEKIVSDALLRAEQIFQNARIRVIWLREVPDSVLVANSAPNGPDDDVRYVRIVRRTPPRLVSRTALGVAFPNTTYSTLFYDRLAATAYNTGYPEAVVLGITIAHELGHLLLGTSKHTVGLMAGHWFDLDLHRAALGTLVFSRAEAAGMRSQALRGGNATSTSRS